MSISTGTSVTLGFLATVGGVIIGGLKWLLGIKHKQDEFINEIKKDVDRHTLQLDDIDKRTEQNSTLHKEINDKLSKQGDQIARMETKLDLIIDNKIK